MLAHFYSSKTQICGAGLPLFRSYTADIYAIMAVYNLTAEKAEHLPVPVWSGRKLAWPGPRSRPEQSTPGARTAPG